MDNPYHDAMPSSAPAKAREEYKRVNAELSRQYCDWENAENKRANDELFKQDGDWRRIAALYDVRSSPAYADRGSCVQHAYRTALRLFADCWHPTKAADATFDDKTISDADDPEKGTLRFPDSVKGRYRNVVYIEDDKAADKAIDDAADDARDGDIISRCMMGGEQVHNEFLKFLMSKKKGKAGRPKYTERDQIFLWIFRALDHVYGPESDNGDRVFLELYRNEKKPLDDRKLVKERPHLEGETLIDVLGAALECGYYVSREGKQRGLTLNMLKRIITAERAAITP